MLARVRKAVIAGVGAGLAALAAALVNAAHAGLTSEEVSTAVGLGMAAAVSVGYGTWRVPNEAAR